MLEIFNKYNKNNAPASGPASGSGSDRRGDARPPHLDAFEWELNVCIFDVDIGMRYKGITATKVGGGATTGTTTTTMPIHRRGNNICTNVLSSNIHIIYLYVDTRNQMVIGF